MTKQKSKPKAATRSTARETRKPKSRARPAPVSSKPATGPSTKHARIIAMRADHLSIPRIARQVRCTERYVYKVLALERITSTPAPVAKHFKRGIISRRP